MDYVVKKFLQLLAVLFVVSFVTFFMLSRLEGDVVIVWCGLGCTEEQADEVRRDLGLDQPVPVQYVLWLQQVVVEGDFGASQLTGQPVSEALSERLPVTLQLVVYSQVIALGVALPLGMASARRPGGVVDRGGGVLAAVAISVPNYVFAFVFIVMFAVWWQIFPPTGYTSFENHLPDVGAQLSNLGSHLRSLFLPALCLALFEMAVYTRLLRNDLISTLQEDYITMAKAKGLPSRYIMRRHAFRPSTFSLVTILGLNIGRLIGGTIVIEVIFTINGLGLYVVQAINSRDSLPLQAAVLVIAAGYVIINFLVDLFYAYLDPRIRHARAAA